MRLFLNSKFSLCNFFNKNFRFFRFLALSGGFHISCIKIARNTGILFYIVGNTITLSIHLSHASEPDTQAYLPELRTCGQQFTSSVSVGSRCLIGRGLKAILENNGNFVDKSGKQLFGERFQLVSQLRWSSTSSIEASIGGNIDIIIPVSSTGIKGISGTDTALFFQQGITRWWDNSGAARNDIRHGFAHRFHVSEQRNSGIFGLYGFFLRNLEHRHELVVFGTDYAGHWGTGALRYYLPISGWKSARPGYQERALEGAELDVALNLTTTTKFSLTGYRWQREDATRQWVTEARLGLDWRPHSWVGIRAKYEGIGQSDHSVSFFARINIPIGGTGKVPRWNGLGHTSGGASPGAAVLWRPVEEIGQIRIATRASAATSNDLNVRFLHERVGSGESVQVEVSLRETANEDINVIVRLVPGDGENPAVAGEDFSDEPVEATISSGSRRVVLSIPLLRNENMEEGRSLGVTASVAS